ncbi:interleukin-1 receptor-associated kinase 3 [Acipenser oxyrinchus oxyrinchus]|uniref:Interleukin-1 receptor-associated kinase 3 n=1 Tax=Acipenser oxyrinchus oxyrinchus TaxID=40147 RepID=A0AAD8DCC6_ACIOX|nr:interleukin-1 receptor-associated kinase 3 [Acipenser oxyrinchus oxyrinchus]
MSRMTNCILTTSTSLFDVPPLMIEQFCKILDSSDGDLGWRGLAERILPDWLEVRRVERMSEQGKSRTRELLWSWAQRNGTVGDLVHILQEMDHQRAIQVFRQQGLTSASSPWRCDQLKAGEISDHRECYQMVNNADAWELAYESHARSGAKQQSLISYPDIIEGTRNFHQDLKIGEGAFSEVYRAVMRNQTYAVKLFKQGKQTEWKKLWKLFMSEINVLILYHHPHIIELSGYCSDNGSYCLVYPYMHNGSLHSRLHCPPDKPTLLPWETRLNVVKGTAQAIQYLHTAQPCAVICGNITSANILLDERFEPKLCDFGMASLRPHTFNQSSTISLDPGTRRAWGYQPEEYIRDGKLSVKLDVYSFGVVIMEVLSGRRAVQEGPRHTLLRDLVTEAVEGSGGVDSCLQFLDERAGSWPHAVSLKLFHLAINCTASRARVRPLMKTVLDVLSELNPACYSAEDQPHTLKDMEPPPLTYAQPHMSLPVENDEIQDFHFQTPELNTDGSHQREQGRAQKSPCECSQSQVMFRESDTGKNAKGSEAIAGKSPNSVWRFLLPGSGGEDRPVSQRLPGPYCSRAVECSCASGEAGGECEECRASGFLLTTPVTPRDIIQSADRR